MANYSFSANIDKFCKATKVKGENVVKKLAFDAFGKLIMRSPIRTGRFRASWRMALNSPDLSFEPPRRKAHKNAGKGGSIPAEIGELLAPAQGLSSFKWGDNVYITNNLNYAQMLEDGYSPQAHAFVKLTFEEMVADVQRIANSVDENAVMSPVLGTSGTISGTPADVGGVLGTAKYLTYVRQQQGTGYKTGQSPSTIARGTTMKHYFALKKQYLAQGKQWPPPKP